MFRRLTLQTTLALAIVATLGACSTPASAPNCHDPCGSPWMMEDTGGVRASAGRGRSIL